jgi:hypothetical protein
VMSLIFHHFLWGLPTAIRKWKAKCLSVCLHCRTSHSQFIVASFCLWLYRCIHCRSLPLWEEAVSLFWLRHFRLLHGDNGCPWSSSDGLKHCLLLSISSKVCNVWQSLTCYSFLYWPWFTA